MGNLCSVSISVDNIFNRCWDSTAGQANFICNLEENKEALGREMRQLTEIKNDVKRRVEVDEQQQMKRLDEVQGWISRVEVVETEVQELIREATREIGNRCFGGCCPKNCKSSYKVGKKVMKKRKDVADLTSGGNFEVVADKLPLPSVDERPSEPTVGLELTFVKVWSCLREEEVGIMGLYGMGGVGKTTLLTKINNEFLKTTHDYDVVIWVVVSKDPNMARVQDDIWKKIRFCDDMWKNKNQDEKARDIFRVLSRKKFVLLLDDIWKRFDLSKVGVPHPDKQNKSKLIFTTRSEEVCGRMGAHKRIKVECLARNEAWDLFQKNVGEDTLNFHSEIPQLAKIVAEKCDGLPLALITIGRAMTCKRTPEEWNHAIAVLKKSASEFSGMGDEVFPLLKFSYDSLPSEAVKSCFLYCSLFPEDFGIHQTDLIDHWIGEGFLDEFDDINQGHDIMGTLIRACLLESRLNSVRMHDVVRDMALWIACECGKAKDKFLVQTGANLTTAPNMTQWKEVERISLMHNCIEELTGTPKCPNLLTFFLNGNGLKMIASDFFQFMPNLRVLNLSKNKGLIELPLEITKLVSLQYINLSYTNIRQLPIEFKNLVNLKCLNLNFTTKLNVIPRHVISSFSMLQVFRIDNCGASYQVVLDGSVLSSDGEALVEELQCLKHLNHLSIIIKSFSALQRILSSHKLQSCTEALSLQFLNGCISLNMSSLGNMKRLNELDINECDDLEDLKIDWAGEGREIQAHGNLYNSMITTHICFHRLCHIFIRECPKLEDLTWLIFAPNLIILSVFTCTKLEEVIRGDKWGEAAEHRGNLNPFAKLEELFLFNLPQLKSVYWNALPFPYLSEIYVRNCPNLKKLPLNSNSAKGGGTFIQGQPGWWKELEWEDEATQNTFRNAFYPQE